MSEQSYQWRELRPDARKRLLRFRKERRFPWHSPPHQSNPGETTFHITAACYEHRPYIGRTTERMDSFARNLLNLFEENSCQTFAWCVLPNHYHVLIETADITGALKGIGKLHGRTSYQWNGEDHCRGRKVFFRSVERAMKSDRHFWATLNYVHHNPVHHGYVEHWTDWPWSSARDFLDQTDRTEAARIWREYPIDDYGKGWDNPEF